MSNPETPTQKFSYRLKTAREARGLSQTDLAKRAGMVPSAIGHFEGDRRKPSFANVRVLAQALKVTSDYLFGRSDSMKGATTVFRGEEHLTSDDRDWIQRLIDSKTQENKQTK